MVVEASRFVKIRSWVMGDGEKKRYGVWGLRYEM